MTQDRFESLLRAALRARPTPRAMADLAARAMARARAIPAEAAQRLLRLRWWGGVGTIVAMFLLVVVIAYGGWALTQTRQTESAATTQQSLGTGEAAQETGMSATILWSLIGVGALAAGTVLWVLRRGNEGPLQR